MLRVESMFNSFKHAWRGLLEAFFTEQSFRLQIAAAIIIAALSLLLPLERWERAFIVLAIGGVLVLELLNSVVERVVDIVKPRIFEYARQIKDLSAAAVLVMSITAFALAVIIFYPYLALLVRL